MKLVAVTIDGIKTEVEDRAPLIQAAQKAGVVLAWWFYLKQPSIPAAMPARFISATARAGTSGAPRHLARSR